MFTDELTYIEGPSAIANDGNKVVTFAAKVNETTFLPAFKKISLEDDQRLLTDVLHVTGTVEEAFEDAKRLAEAWCGVSRAQGTWSSTRN